MIPKNHLSPEWQNALAPITSPEWNAGGAAAPGAPAAPAASPRGQAIDNGLAARGATLLAAGRVADPSVRTGSRLLGNFDPLG